MFLIITEIFELDCVIFEGLYFTCTRGFFISLLILDGCIPVHLDSLDYYCLNHKSTVDHFELIPIPVPLETRGGLVVIDLKSEDDRNLCSIKARIVSDMKNIHESREKVSTN